jgi:hypothetical protein
MPGGRKAAILTLRYHCQSNSFHHVPPPPDRTRHIWPYQSNAHAKAPLCLILSHSVPILPTPTLQIPHTNPPIIGRCRQILSLCRDGQCPHLPRLVCIDNSARRLPLACGTIVFIESPYLDLAPETRARGDAPVGGDGQVVTPELVSARNCLLGCGVWVCRGEYLDGGGAGCGENGRGRG